MSWIKCANIGLLLTLLLLLVPSRGVYAQADDATAFELVALTTGLSKGGYEQSLSFALFTRWFTKSLRVLVIAPDHTDDTIVNQDLTHIYLNARSAGLTYQACGAKLTARTDSSVAIQCKSPQLVVLYKNEQTDEQEAKRLIGTLDFVSDSAKSDAFKLMSEAWRSGNNDSCMAAISIDAQRILAGMIIVDDKVTAERSLCFLSFTFRLFGVTPYIAPVAVADQSAAFTEMYASQDVGPNAHTALRFLYSNLIVEGMSSDEYLGAAFRWLDQHN